MQTFEGFSREVYPQVVEATGVARSEWQQNKAAIAGLPNRQIGEYILVTEVTSSGMWYYHYLFDSMAEARQWGRKRQNFMNSYDIEDRNAPYRQNRS